MTDNEVYEVFAVRYGQKRDKRRGENFMGSVDRPDEPMPTDFYVWAIRNERRVIVVDTGFDAAEAKRRNREPIRTPREGLAMLGIDSRQIENVVVTHLHYDHAGTLYDFPVATFHLQDDEMVYATGRHMVHELARRPYAREPVMLMLEKVYSGRVSFHHGDAEIAPGVSVHHIGGHTKGMQCVRVRTQRGWLVLASDASHYYGNMDEGIPYPAVYNVAETLEGYRRLRELASSPDAVIPGHDPLVMARYPTPAKELDGIAVRLDAGRLVDQRASSQ